MILEPSGTPVRYNDVLLDDEPFITPEPAMTLETKTTTAETTPTRSFPIAVGSTVRYLGVDAVVIAIADPNNPRSSVDVVYCDPTLGGQRRIASDIEHGGLLSQWITQAEVDAGRPLTPLELVEAARLRGEQVPEVGAVVYFARSEGAFGTCLINRRRMGITAVHSLTEVDGIVLADRDLEGDPEAPDVPLALHGIVTRSRHASEATDWTKAEFMKGCWSYTSEDLIPEQSGPHRWVDVHPPYVCDSCKSRCVNVLPITIGQTTGAKAKTLSLCPVCHTAAMELLNQTAEAPARFWHDEKDPAPPNKIEIESDADLEVDPEAKWSEAEASINARLDAIV
jgi:hypothetical protein